MKINWGTGIVITLVIFLILMAAFIIFASRQSINLVHKDYYERGVEYSEKMKVDSRSVKYQDMVHVVQEDSKIILKIDESLVFKVDSGNVVLYRPSDCRRDVKQIIQPNSSKVEFDRSELLRGRYIMKLFWYSEGLNYQIDKEFTVR